VFFGEGGKHLPVGPVVDAAIDVLAERAEPERHLEIVDSFAAQIELIRRLIGHRPQKGWRDQRRKCSEILAPDCAGECRTHLLERSVRLVQFFKDDLDLGIGDLLRLRAAGRRREKNCRDKKTTPKVACRHVHGNRLFVVKSRS
jgi:hypothetical protein